MEKGVKSESNKKMKNVENQVNNNSVKKGTSVNNIQKNQKNNLQNKNRVNVNTAVGTKQTQTKNSQIKASNIKKNNTQNNNSNSNMINKKKIQQEKNIQNNNKNNQIKNNTVIPTEKTTQNGKVQQNKFEQRDTTGDTKIFKIIKKEDIEREKKLQAIKNENKIQVQKNEEKNTPKYNNYQKNNTETKLNNYKIKSKNNNEKKGLLIFTLIILILILISLIVSTIFGLINQNSNKIIKGVYINNIEVSNLTKQEAKLKLDNQLNNEEENYITVTHNEYSKQIHLSDIQGKFNTEESVNVAYSMGRNENIITDNYKTIQTMLANENISTTFTYNQEMLEGIINQIAIELPDLATEASYIVNENKLIIKNSNDGIQIKSSDFKQNVIDSFSTGKSAFEIPVEKVERKEINIEEIYNEIYKEEKNAYYTTNPRQVYKEEYGLDFAITLEQAKAMLAENKEEYEIPLKTVKPKVTVANLDSEAFPDQLGTFTTNYGTGDVNRNTNIAIAAKSINSVVVMPGETFSYNDLIGECSTRTGYKESTIYLNGELSKGIGGGICQVSTTLYNAVLRANLEIVERRNHSLRVTYVPAGHDAMVSIGSQDFKFKNNRDYPIKVVAFVGTGSITCQIYGLKQDTEYEVKLVSTTLENTDTKQKVQTYKVLYLNGKEVSRTLLSTDTYKKH